MPELIVWLVLAVTGLVFVWGILALLDVTVTTVRSVCRNCGDDPLGYDHEPIDRGICRVVLPARR